MALSIAESIPVALTTKVQGSVRRLTSCHTRPRCPRPLVCSDATTNNPHSPIATAASIVLGVDSTTTTRRTQHESVLEITVSIRDAHLEISSRPFEIIVPPSTTQNSDRIEPDVEALGLMGQPADADPINTTLRHIAAGLVRYAAGCFEQHT